MIQSLKIKLYPTKEQEQLMWQSVGVNRFAYNWGLARSESYYREHEKSLSNNDLRKEFTQLRKTDEHPWLKDVSSEIPQQALKDLGDAYKKFFKKQGGYPKFKKKGKCENSFYHHNNKLKVNDDYVYLEKIGLVKMSDEGRLPKGDYKKDKIKVTNPRIKHNGRYWTLTLGIEVEDKSVELTDVSLGIDVGVKDLAICSDGQVFKNINKSRTIKKLEKRLKRLQRQVSRKYEMNKQGNKFIKTKNIIKLEHQIKLIHLRLTNIRNNHLHQATNKIVKTKPSRIVIEDLNVSGMMKNRHLSKAIQQQKLYEFRRQLEYKTKKYGIELVLADRWYPSSKTCSKCGTIKSDLKLKDRVFNCDCCGLEIDRDLNASINLSRYNQ